jgi:cytoskeletal protein CcmA (bactofilin family)
MFGRKPSTEHEAMALTRSGSGQSFSVLGSDLAIKGDITASSDLHIDGAVEGDITCESLVQGETSKISGAISAKSARLSGHIDGSITCGQLVILKSARITGDVHYDALTIEQGAIVDGRLSPYGSAKPQTAQAPAENVLILSDAAE